MQVMDYVVSWNRIYLLIVSILCILTLCGGRELRIGDAHSGISELRIADAHSGIAGGTSSVYNRTLARILVEYASAVYIDDLSALLSWTCSRCNGLTKGFQIIEIIVDVQHCLQAYVGIADDLNAIVIAFRGTQEKSLQNWVEDLFWKTLDLKYPDMPGAMVHHGFYSAYHNTTLREHVVAAVQEAQDNRDRLSIMVTGHSMGGAMASFCALDLVVNYGATDVNVVTFGQPRIGNSVFASYYQKFVPKAIRCVHGHDIVPHLPPYYTYFPSRTYHHFAREVWLYKVGIGIFSHQVEKLCDESGEDPSCSRSVYGNSVVDHLTYYGVSLKAEDAVTCRIIWLSQENETTGSFITQVVSSSERKKHGSVLTIDGKQFFCVS